MTSVFSGDDRLCQNERSELRASDCVVLQCAGRTARTRHGTSFYPFFVIVLLTLIFAVSGHAVEVQELPDELLLENPPRTCGQKPCSSEQFKSQATLQYPDIWYREFTAPQDIADMFFSDQGEWGNEPVVLLFEDNKTHGRAKGFFSGKSMKVYRTFSAGACSVRQGYQYYYSKNKRKMTRRYISPQKPCSGITDLPDGGSLQEAWDMTLLVGEMERGIVPENQRLSILSEIAKDTGRNENRTYETIGRAHTDCEPIGKHLIKKSSSGEVMWVKSLVRYYPSKKVVSAWYEGMCGFDAVTLMSEASQHLLLPDGSILVVAPGAVVRIRQDNGSMPINQMPTAMKILDASDVIKAKLEIMRRQARAIQQCRTEGKPLKGLNSCTLYRITDKDFDRLQSDLAKELNFQ